MRRTTAILVICALLASAAAGLLIGQSAGDGSRDTVPNPGPGGTISTPAATPDDLPPFFFLDDRDQSTVSMLLPESTGAGWMQILTAEHAKGVLLIIARTGGS